MNATHYTFVAPIDIPTMRDMQEAYLDVVENEAGDFKLAWRRLEDWPAIVRKSTGERGRLVRSIGNNILELPQRGKANWDEGDWQLID